MRNNRVADILAGRYDCVAGILTSRYGFVSIVLVTILLGFQIRYGIVPAWSAIHSDFPNYYTSSRLLLEGEDLSRIYDDAWFQRKIYGYGMGEMGKFSPFPPPTAFVMLPAAALPPVAAKRAFLLANVIVMVLAAFLITKISHFSYLGACTIIMLSGAALSNNFMLGQFYLILLTLSLWGYLFFLHENHTASGVAWGIGAAVKYFPLIYLPAIVLKRNWKALASLLVTFLFVNAAACLLFGAEACAQFFRSVFLSHLDGELSGQSNYSIAFQSWNSLLRNIFVYDPVENPSPLFRSVAAFQFVRVVIYCLFPAAAIAVLYRSRNARDLIPYSIIIFSLLAFVLTPASASYHLVLLVFPVVLLLALSSGTHPAYSASFIILYAMIGFSPVLLHGMNRETFGLVAAYHRLWIVVILFIVSLRFIMLRSMRFDCRGVPSPHS